ncbi:type II toxin-antitoxin system VapC family toxin [Jiangella gansuensis]|uniref:type II toxin-antitoxin system VapC family toxin n=1 Tax=Jiangella gansuensis TaxID=281473 RepID=UPI00047903DC|nr:type II toxin-antitoxin system VapC family toxin [Jiangella gansuensis]
MTAFADSSALVKLYADESGADAVRRLELIVVSELARVEVPAAVWKKHRLGEISAHHAAILVAEFEADYFGTDDEPARFVVITATPQVLDEAARLTARHGLRAYDAVQLACAGATRDAAAERIAFAAFDKALLEAAAAEGHDLLPGDTSA